MTNPNGIKHSEADDCKKLYSNVYPEHKMSSRRVPATLFIPSQKLMWDIMRACIGIKYSDDLWFHHIEKWKPEGKFEEELEDEVAEETMDLDQIL